MQYNLLLPLSLHAGFIKEWQFKETASAPVLVTGRIIGVHRNERVPEDQLSWKAETWSMTADVEVLRSFTASGMPLAVEILCRFVGPMSPTTGLTGCRRSCMRVQRCIEGLTFF